jgi:hypothetical protein
MGMPVRSAFFSAASCPDRATAGPATCAEPSQLHQWGPFPASRRCYEMGLPFLAMRAMLAMRACFGWLRSWQLMCQFTCNIC